MQTNTAQVLTAQEIAINEGRKTLYEGATDRVLRLLEAIRGYGPTRVTSGSGSRLHRIF